MDKTYKNQKVRWVTISYVMNNIKCSVSSSPEGAEMMMDGLKRDGAINVKILHYFNDSGLMIK